MSRVWLGLGANLGERRANIDAAIDRLAEHGRVLRCSELSRTTPVDAGGADYLNGVCEIETELDPGALLAATQAIEQAAGRRTKGDNAPRPLDIDILLYDDRVIDTPDLVVPHPRLQLRAFVLEPLAELAPDLVHPVLRRTIQSLARELERN